MMQPAASVIAPPLSRLQRLALTDYRAFLGSTTADGSRLPIAIDLAADLVLVVGSNGSGKSSLIYAVDGCLNGDTARIRAAGRKPSFIAPDPAAPEGLRRSGLLASEAIAAVSDAEDEERRIRYTPSGVDARSLPANALPAETLEQASVFYQDGGGASPASFNRFLLAPSSDRDRVLTALREARTRLELSRSSLAPPGTATAAAIAVQRRKAAAELVRAALQVQEQTGLGVAPPLVQAEDESVVADWERPLAAYAAGLARTLAAASAVPADGRSALAALIALAPRLPVAPDSRSRLAAALRGLPAALPLAYRDGALRNVGELDRKYPTAFAPARLEEVLNQLGGGDPSAPDFFTAWSTVVKRLEIWQPAVKQLDEMLHELGHQDLLPRGINRAFSHLFGFVEDDGGGVVLSERLTALRSTLQHLLMQTQMQANEERSRSSMQPLVHELLQLGDAVPPAERSSEPAPAARWLERLGATRAGSGEALAAAARQWLAVEEADAQRQAQQAADPGVLAAQRTLDQALALLREELDDRGLLAAAVRLPLDQVHILDQALSEVLHRFNLPEGMLPVRLRPDDAGVWQLFTADGLPLPSLSTGQKALVALGWCVAVNLAIRDQMPHRTLLLDDIGAALDAAQLTPLALLLRQLAYTPADHLRRQVIVTVHHEEHAARLLQLLQPPPGRELVVLELPAHGIGEPPQPRSWRVPQLGDGAPASDDDFRAVLAQALGG